MSTFDMNNVTYAELTRKYMLQEISKEEYDAVNYPNKDYHHYYIAEIEHVYVK